MEKPFEDLVGVLSVQSGYAGGRVKNPTYEQVSAGTTGHIEVVQIEYDPYLVSQEKILSVFWKNIDPFDGEGQFCDKGDQYVSALFYASAEQNKSFEKSWQDSQSQLKISGSRKTKFIPNSEFYLAEGYHQDYYRNNPIRYKYYRGGCGRDKRLQQLWKQ